MPSHYCRLRFNRLYLEGPFDTKQEVYNLYVEHCTEENLRTLSKLYLFEFLEEKHFSIFHPRKDECDTCTSFKMKQINEEEYKNHKNMKERAQDEKKNDKIIAKNDNQYIVLTMDLQSVKLCPVLKTSGLYYSMKLKFTILQYTILQIIKVLTTGGMRRKVSLKPQFSVLLL